jgi:hypothetical protein
VALVAPGEETAPSATLVRVRGEAATRGGARAAHVLVAQISADGGATVRSALKAAPRLLP